jgi:hypothetical protein
MVRDREAKNTCAVRFAVAMGADEKGEQQRRRCIGAPVVRAAFLMLFLLHVLSAQH